MDIESGYCLTKCPYGIDCYVNSQACTKCVHHFGLAEGMPYIRCTGERNELFLNK